MRKFNLYLKMFRVKQWAKNGLVFFPVIIFPTEISVENFRSLLITFAVFCCASSLVYIINDWSDRESDAKHHTKKLRPFAAGDLILRDAIAGFIILAAVLAPLTWEIFIVSPTLVVLIAAYLAQSFLYSFYLKNVTLLELLVVSTGYSYRALAGGLSVALLPSIWMLVTIFLASIFMVAQKRLSDISYATEKIELRSSVRAYPEGFLNLITAISASAAILSFILFTLSDYAQVKFHNPYLPISSVFIIYATFRYLQVAMDSLSGHDPIQLIMRDRHIKACIILCLLFILSTNI